MKQLILIAVTSMATQLSFGQQSLFPAVSISNATQAGYVGIGTKSTTTTTNTPLPNFNLHLNGTSDFFTFAPFPNPPLNVGKTFRLGFTNTSTGMTSADGVELRLSENNFTLENRENGNIFIGIPNLSMIFSNSSSRLWVGTVSNMTSTDQARMNIIAPSTENGFYIQAPTTSGKYGLSVRMIDNASDAIQVNGTLNFMGSNIPIKNFSVKGNGEVNSGNVNIVSPTSSNAIAVVTSGSSTINFKVSSEGVVETKDLFVKGTLRVQNASGSNQFSINGSGFVRARDILVDYEIIPDYVFKKDYRLMPLVDLEKFIKEFNHLPNIKSENEFNKEEGLSLGEINLKLLEKVEELTLYVIDLQKQINELKSNK